MTGIPHHLTNYAHPVHLVVKMSCEVGDKLEGGGGEEVTVGLLQSPGRPLHFHISHASRCQPQPHLLGHIPRLSCRQ